MGSNFVIGNPGKREIIPPTYVWLEETTDGVDLVAQLGDVRKSVLRLNSYGIARFNSANGVGIDATDEGSCNLVHIIR